MNAGDIMRRRVVTVHPETTLRELRRLLSDRQISGAPVVGPRGDLIGVVSHSDLIARTHRAPSTPPSYHVLADDAPAPRALAARDRGQTVASVMTPWVISFEAETPVEELARQMLAKRIHRVVITREGRLCGIVTALDLLGALLSLLLKKPRRPNRNNSFA